MRRFLIAVITIMKDILIFAIFTYKLLLLEFPPISTWHLSNQQVLIINYFFSTANILQVLQWQVTFRSLHPFLRPHTYQQEEHNRWSSFFLLSKQGLSPYHFPVTSDHSCNDSVGFADKSSAPAHYPLPKDMEKMRKAEKLEFLHGISEKVVHSFIFQSGEELQKLVDGVLTEEKEDILQQQELTAEGRFPCRFPGCNKSFKYNGKQEGTMNCPMIHLFSLRILCYWPNLHLDVQPLQKRPKQAMMCTTVTVHFWQITFYFPIFFM